MDQGGKALPRAAGDAHVERRANSTLPWSFAEDSALQIPTHGRDSDRMERNSLTGTIGCASNMHRCFSVSGTINTPSCKNEELQMFLRAEAAKKVKASAGWSQSFICSESSANGAVFPACVKCRQANLQAMGMQFAKKTSSSCKKCCDWELLPSCSRKAALLAFPPPNEYPTDATDGSPVPPPP